MPQAAGRFAFAGKMHYILQLLLLIAVVRLYSVESPSFFRVFVLAVMGFIVSTFLPMRYRLAFFALLSFTGVFVVFGLHDGLLLIGCGLLLIAIVHLPLPFYVRVLALVSVGGLLAASRSGLVESPWSQSVWPILGSMFMFRLVLYALAARDKRKFEGGIWGAISYFFMLPNLVFPLFPVIDYLTFRRTYFDRDENEIYEQGLSWMVRGVVHLLLYRLVYYNLLTDPSNVFTLGDLVQYMLATLLLYLRVSGQFHLIVGMLHLFGFRLPETHKLYYLSHGFTELWRRINIYWTEFMMKLVFYPTYFRIRRLGQRMALSCSTIIVFLATWLLHSYQWFWLRGGFPLTIQDVAFWALLCSLVLISALKELKTVKKPKQSGRVWDAKQGLRAAATFSIFCFLWSLWSAHSVSQWIWMLSGATRVDAKGLLLLLATFGVVMFLGGLDRVAAGAGICRLSTATLNPWTRQVGTLVFLLVLGQSVVQAMAPAEIAASLNALRTTGLNRRDAALQHRGYYEQLDVQGQPPTMLLEVASKNVTNWERLAEKELMRDRKDFLLRDLLPSRSVVWNGNAFSTNQWGMRDKEYTREKPPRTLRIALLGPSHVMGNGVPDGSTFEAMVEDRLNAEYRHGDFDSFEILNFGVDGYPLLQQIAILDERVLDFSPDMIVATHYSDNLSMTNDFLKKIIWGDIPIPYPRLNELMERAGLANIDRGKIPVPYSLGRKLARWAGIDCRMPHGELVARISWIADDALEWSFRRFSEVTASQGIQPLVLGLDVVSDGAPADFPNRPLIAELGLPFIDLFGVFAGREPGSLRVAPWDDHPNIAGHRIVAERLYAELVGFLDSYDPKSSTPGRRDEQTRLRTEEALNER